LAGSAGGKLAMSRDWSKDRGVRAAGLAIVLALHGAAFWGLWAHRLIPTPGEAVTVFVDFIAPPMPPMPPTPPKVEPVPRRVPPQPPPEEKPRRRQLVAEGVTSPPGEALAPAPLPAPVIAAAPEAKPAVGPVVLATELAVSCPERAAPDYPLLSRRLGEGGIAVVRVELDELGRVSAARVASGSGFGRLDAAALDAVRTWRCNPAQRDGRPVRAVALQAFKFVLQGN